MSDLANKERANKQRWAVPGSAHDAIVRWSKIALPAAVGILSGVSSRASTRASSGVP